MSPDEVVGGGDEGNSLPGEGITGWPTSAPTHGAPPAACLARSLDP